jgi:D-3-phosphoglycerate dehydrogenase / 2-oxoglutarate reductase
LKLENVIVCDHMGGLDEESMRATATLAARCLADLYQGRWPEACVVNRSLWPGWKW